MFLSFCHNRLSTVESIYYVHISYVSVELKKPSVGLNLCCMLRAEEQTDGNISGFDLYCLNPAPFIVLSVKVLIAPEMFRLSSQRLLRFDDRIITKLTL